jgi:hypothetical protein
LPSSGDAGVVYYGVVPGDPAALGGLRAPVLGLYGGDAARIGTTIESARSRMGELGSSYLTIAFLRRHAR